MKLSMQATIAFAALFAAVCLGVGITGFMSLGDITEEARLADAKGFAAFWSFLGIVGVALAAGAWWIARRPEPEEE